VRNKEISLGAIIERLLIKYSPIIAKDLFVTLHGGEPLLA